MVTKKKSKAAVATSNPVREQLLSETEIEKEMSLSSAVSIQERIALLAYTYWVQRGCQGGSQEEDWYRAEREILSQTSQAEL